MISYRVMKTDKWDGEYSKAQWYKIPCDCGNDNCTLTFEIEFDKEDSITSAIFYKDMWWSTRIYPQSKHALVCFFCEAWARICGAIRLLFVGRIEMEGDLVLRGPEHIAAFIEALKEGMEFVKEKP